MSEGPFFVDTNLLVYFRDTSEPEKQKRAASWMNHLIKGRTGRLSTQVLNEYFVTVTRKLDPGLSPRVAWLDVSSLLSWKPAPVDAGLLKSAYAVQERFKLSWWDSLIVAAARNLGCSTLLSEDMQDGQNMDGLMVLNPFTNSPPNMGQNE